MKREEAGLVDFESKQTQKVLVGVGLLGFGLLVAAAVALVVVRKREEIEEPDLDALLGIGA